jgi:hypothetical protein
MSIDITILAQRSRFVIVHFHLFKNAGSTLEHILEREFPGCFARMHGPLPESILDGEDLATFLRDHPGVKAVTSHHLRYPLPAIRHTVIFDWCFLRHPLDRLDSLYWYFRKLNTTDPICRMARNQTPAEFVRHLIRHSPEQVANVQVNQLANAGVFVRPAHSGDLQRAVETVRNMALPGLVEMFPESMVAGEYFMRPAFPFLRLAAEARNVGRPEVRNAREREERLIRHWGPDLHRELLKLNELDIELFMQTGDEIRRRISLIPDLQVRLTDFSDRCRQAAQASQAEFAAG